MFAAPYPHRPTMGLTAARRRVLEWFADHRDGTFREAADALTLSRHAVHLNVQGLRALGLMASVAGARARMNRITPAGYAALGRQARCASCGQEICT